MGTSDYPLMLTRCPDNDTDVPFALLVIFLLAIPKMYFNLRSRRGTTARSNGLPVHSRNSLSRSLLGSRRGMKSYEEEQDEFDSALISDEDDASFGPHRGPGQGRGATPDGAGGDEADDSIVIHDAYYGSGGGAGYPMSPPHTGTGNQYAYHSPTDDDWMHVGTPREIVPRQGQARVRRVSRGKCESARRAYTGPKTNVHPRSLGVGS